MTTLHVVTSRPHWLAIAAGPDHVSKPVHSHGSAVSVTVLPSSNTASHTPGPPSGSGGVTQLMSGFGRGLCTVPEALATSGMVTCSTGRVNVAVTVLGDVMSTVHCSGCAGSARQGDAPQPPNSEPAAGCAVSVTAGPTGKLSVQALGALLGVHATALSGAVT